jgi:hypothetical protein
LLTVVIDGMPIQEYVVYTLQTFLDGMKNVIRNDLAVGLGRPISVADADRLLERDERWSWTVAYVRALSVR